MNEARGSLQTDPRGVALLSALITLTVIVVMAVFLVSSTTVNRRLAGDDVTRSKALHYAEAGVYEALNRIQNNQGPNPNRMDAPRSVVQILLSTRPGFAGQDTTLLGTGQPLGEWLPYSTERSGADALTIEFVTDASRSKIYRYDAAKTPSIQTETGDPIYRITSVGRVGNVRRRLVVEAAKPTYRGLRSAVVSGSEMKYVGGSVTCGYNHRGVTPENKGIAGRETFGGCRENSATNEWEVGYGDRPGVMVYGPFSSHGSSLFYGSPSGVSEGNTGFYDGPWEVFGISRADFMDWVGSCIRAPDDPMGAYYIDNDGIPGNRSNPSVTYDEPTHGSGLLYVDGDLKISNDFRFRGLIYCEGKLTVTNRVWILGSMVARGPEVGRNDITGSNVFLYSSEAVAAIPGAPRAASVMEISWREKP